MGFFFINTVKSLYSVILEVQSYMGAILSRNQRYFSYDYKELFYIRKASYDHDVSSLCKNEMHYRNPHRSALEWEYMYAKIFFW